MLQGSVGKVLEDGRVSVSIWMVGINDERS